ncbi:MAG: DUF1080 domain-containing protein [Polyangiaceae bacterium]|nr:DUF1080 domain-containing protein [Polyangiaceae bacterium]
MPLFDGADASGWSYLGGGEMRLLDGYARTHGDGVSLGLWYYSLRTFKNFELNVEFRQSVVGANSGVFVRFPDPRGNVLRPISQGYEVQIARAPGTSESTGAIYSFQAADPKGELTEPGLFNQLQIRVVDQNYEVSLNGQLINSFVGRRNLEGYVGIQVHDSPTDIVDVRRVEITDLP